MLFLNLFFRYKRDKESRRGPEGTACELDTDEYKYAWFSVYAWE